jgi:hypothetical protein
VAPAKFRITSRMVSLKSYFVLSVRKVFLKYLEAVGILSNIYSPSSQRKVTIARAEKIITMELVKFAKNIATKNPPKECSNSKNQ